MHIDNLKCVVHTTRQAHWNECFLYLYLHPAITGISLIPAISFTCRENIPSETLVAPASVTKPNFLRFPKWLYHFLGGPRSQGTPFKLRAPIFSIFIVLRVPGDSVRLGAATCWTVGCRFAASTGSSTDGWYTDGSASDYSAFDGSASDGLASDGPTATSVCE